LTESLPITQYLPLRDRPTHRHELPHLRVRQRGLRLRNGTDRLATKQSMCIPVEYLIYMFIS